jgi:hypothetical protein
MTHIQHPTGELGMPLHGIFGDWGIEEPDEKDCWVVNISHQNDKLDCLSIFEKHCQSD